LILALERLHVRSPSGCTNMRLAGIAVLLFSIPVFFGYQVRAASDRVQQIWGPVLGVRNSDPEPGSWVIIEDEAPGFRAEYLGASPEWLTHGFRILSPKGGSPDSLKQQNPDQRIYRYHDQRLDEVLPQH
ncbi:MAG: hypothetical protein ABIK28_11485, partial [Planctomycetota bacterium]